MSIYRWICPSVNRHGDLFRPVVELGLPTPFGDGDSPFLRVAGPGIPDMLKTKVGAG